MKSNKIALFDFCGTIANFQTFDPYIEYVIKKNDRDRFWVGNKTCKRLLSYFGKVIGIHNLYKKIIVRMIKGIDYNILDRVAQDYFTEKIENNCYEETLELIKGFQEEGYRIIILSAGCDLYIRYFAEKYRIDDVVATELEISNGRATGKIRNSDCIGVEKIYRLKEYLNCADLTKVHYSVSDSYSDMPMFDVADNKIVISSSGHQNWVTNEMKEIYV